MEKDGDNKSGIRFQIYRPEHEIYGKQHLCVYMREMLDMAEEEQRLKTLEEAEKQPETRTP